MSTSPPPPQRLNPFAFPSETDTRFVMLVVAVIMISVHMGTIMREIFNPEMPTPLTSLIVSALLVIAALALALLIYRTYPNRVRHSQHLEVFRKEKDPLFHNEIERLAGVASITLPTIELGNTLRDQSGQAFGFSDRYSIRLDAGLRLLLRKAPEKFRAIVLHEMAHIANDDVRRTYFTQALWYAVIFLTLLPTTAIISFHFLLKPLTQGVTISTLVSLYLPRGLFFFIQVFILLAIVGLIRAGLLRARETYADWHAALWGAATLLATILQNQAAKEKPTNPITGLWSLHPAAWDRLNALENPHTLFRLTLDLPFTVGVLIAFQIVGTFEIFVPLVVMLDRASFVLISNLASAVQTSAFELLILLMVSPPVVLVGILVSTILVFPIFGISYLVAWTIGLQVQRQAVAEDVLKRQGCVQGCAKYLSLWVVAAVIALGIEVGFFIIPINVFSPQTLTSALLAIPWLIGATGLTWLWLMFARYFGDRIFDGHVGLTPPKLKLRVLNAALS
ncbi:M48 family metalloprotease, partial [Candidatus Woesearchaeota archaeon]|nr:M48 family metalloprotease [Candidatus Woesearchaeota archaeon]